MEPIEAYYEIRSACLRRPELALKSWPDQPVGFDTLELRPFCGHCYIATQVFCYLIPEAKPYSFGRSHFYAVIGDKVWDLTSEQFDKIQNYSEGKPTRFKNPLCERAEELYYECGYIN